MDHAEEPHRKGCVRTNLSQDGGAAGWCAAAATQEIQQDANILYESDQNLGLGFRVKTQKKNLKPKAYMTSEPFTNGIVDMKNDNVVLSHY